RLVLLDGATHTPSVLIPAEWRRTGSRVDKGARVQRAVPEVFIYGAVETICTALAYGIHHSAVSTELRAIRIRQRLEFSDGLDSQRGPHHRGHSAVPETLKAFVVEQQCLALGSGSS